MSNATYNGQWAGAMAELAEQVHLEDPTLEAEEGAARARLQKKRKETDKRFETSYSVEWCVSRRSRRALCHTDLIAAIGLDTAENGPSKVFSKSDLMEGVPHSSWTHHPD